VCFDSVDDESKPENILYGKGFLTTPAEWNSDQNPPYAYYIYYMWANLNSLNRLREVRGMNTFDLRPHCGESGDVQHLNVSFLLSKNISHGMTLKQSPNLEYLYYLSQIGIALSPLSENNLFVEYDENPFVKFFRRGLNISLATDNPLFFHVTNEPLIEEYAIAAQVYKLTATDMSEIARNSVLQSGFDHKFKVQWLGEYYYRSGTAGNDFAKSNVPNIRIAFRRECFDNEWAFIRLVNRESAKHGWKTPTVIN